MTAISTLFNTLPLLIGPLLIIAAIWEFVSWRLKYSSWSYAYATSLGAIKQTGDVGPRLAYQFDLDGQTYEGVSSYMMNDLPEKGERLDVYFDPSNPEKSDWHHGSLHNTFMIGSALIGAYILWLAL